MYFVATGGSDSADGSRRAPFRTLMRGVQAARPGDTVVVLDGKYGPEGALTGGDSDENNHSPVVLRNSGTAQGWITLMAENKWGATLDCEMRCDSYINLYNAAYFLIQGFVITRGYKEAIHSNDAAHHITLRGNRIEYIANRPSSTSLGLSGMYTNPACHDFLIDGNVFHDIGRTNQVQLDHGLYLHGSNMTITNNIFYNIRHGWSIQAADGLRHALIAHNVFAFKNAQEKPGQIMLWNRQADIAIQNNIFYGGEQYAIARYRALITSCTIDHNTVYGASGVISDPGGCSVAANQIGKDPLFVNATHEPYDFHLRAGSPAIGSAAAPLVDVDFDGSIRPHSAQDAGAFVFKPYAQ
jgi:hypothetical protein